MIRFAPGLRADVFWPAQPCGAGAVFLHGGGFTGGSRAQFEPAARLLAAEYGAVCLLADYRLAGPGAVFPAQAADALAACRWLCGQPGGPKEQELVLVGGSPGGSIAAAALLLKEPRLAGAGVPAHCGRPRRAVLLNPILDLAAFWRENPAERANAAAYAGGGSQEALWAASPLAFPAPGRQFLLLHGERDAVVPPTQCFSFARAMEQAGSRVKVELQPGEGHAWFNAPGKMEPVARRIGRFLQQGE